MNLVNSLILGSGFPIRCSSGGPLSIFSDSNCVIAGRDVCGNPELRESCSHQGIMIGDHSLSLFLELSLRLQLPWGQITSSLQLAIVNKSPERVN